MATQAVVQYLGFHGNVTSRVVLGKLGDRKVLKDMNNRPIREVSMTERDFWELYNQTPWGAQPTKLIFNQLETPKEDFV
jgi:hypothetical protein